MKKKNIFLLIIIIIISSYKSFCYARYNEFLGQTKYYASIAEPIFIVQPIQDIVSIDVNKEYENNISRDRADSENVIKEYIFMVKNYDNVENNIRISEIDIKFKIKILIENNLFPIELKLYDCLSNEEIILDESNCSSEIVIEKNVLFEKQYKLIVYCNKITNISDLKNGEEIIGIEIEACQKA